MKANSKTTLSAGKQGLQNGLPQKVAFIYERAETVKGVTNETVLSKVKVIIA